jgi:hypothetical protein
MTNSAASTGAIGLDPPVVREYLEQGTREPYQIVTLTDEEIVAVDGRRSVAPRFWYDAQPPAAREVAVTAAARGLVARGWAMGSQSATEVESLALEATGPLRTVLGLRRAADRIVLAEQRLDDEARARVYYLLGDSARLGEPGTPPAEPMALEEAVNSGGLHRFSMLTRSAAVEALAAWCTVGSDLTRADRTAQAEAAAGPGLVVERSADVETAVRAVVGVPRVVTVVATVARALEPPDERYLSVYVGDDGVATADRDGRGARLTSLSNDDLRVRIAEMMQ